MNNNQYLALINKSKQIETESNVLEKYANSLYSYEPTIINHRYYVPGYKNIIIGGSIIDKADWEHLHNDFGVTDVINVETEHDDSEKVPAEHLLQVQTEDNGNGFPVDKIMAAIEFAKGPNKVLYIHCQMGGSRSPAWAYAILRGVYGLQATEALKVIIEARIGVHKFCNGRGFQENYGHAWQHQAYLKSIDDALVQNTYLPRLNIGCGPNVFPFDGWINYDISDISPYLSYLNTLLDLATVYPPISIMPEHQQILVRYLIAGGKIDFRVHDLNNGFSQHADESIESIYFGQAIEHLGILNQVPPFLKECHRMLKKGGVIRITTPDLNILIDAYKNDEMDKFAGEQPEFYREADPSSQLAYLMYGACGPNCTRNNYEGHMFLFTQKSMTKFLEAAGFSDIIFYYEKGNGKDPIMAAQAVDEGMSHSFIVEGVKI